MKAFTQDQSNDNEINNEPDENNASIKSFICDDNVYANFGKRSILIFFL